MASVMDGKRTLLTPALAPVERSFYSLSGVDATREQTWLQYVSSLLIFNAAGFVLLYAILRLQDILPLNPQGFGPMSEHLAFNTAVSFVTNTNWQSYAARPPFPISARWSASRCRTSSRRRPAWRSSCRWRGRSRAPRRRRSETSGSILRASPSMCCCRCRSSWRSCSSRWACRRTQPLRRCDDARGCQADHRSGAGRKPARHQAARHQRRRFFNVNSAHPYENPSIWTNTLQSWAILGLALALVVSFGRLIGREREGWTLLCVMMLFMVVGCAVAYWAEAGGNPFMHAMDVAGGNMEGKEVRFGIPQSAVWATFTTGASNGYRQLDARILHAAGRPCPTRADPDRRGGSGRRRLGPLRHRRLRHHRNVRRRTDGRTHAGIPRQEARGEGSEDGHACHPHHAGVHPRLQRHLGGAAGGACRSRQPRAARLHGIPLRLLVGGRQQRLGLRRPQPPTRPGTTRRSASPCWPAASASSYR